MRERGVLAHDAVFDFVEGQKVPGGFTGVALVKHKRAVPQIDFTLRQAQRERKSHMISTHHRSP